MFFFAVYRSIVFALFIICNAILCSVAVWDITSVHTNRSLVNADIYLVILGALGLTIVFPILFIEIYRKNAVVSRAWFEACWTALFSIMNLVGASVVSALAPSDKCDVGDDQLRRLGSPCVSTRVVIAFSWLNTVFLFGYFLVLLILVALHHKEDDKIWLAVTHNYPWFETKTCLRSAPSTPVIARFSRTKPPSFVVPKPRRPAPAFIHGRAGLDSRVEIGHLPDVVTDEEISPVTEISTNPVQANANALALYSHSVQTTYTSNTSVHTETQDNCGNVYSSSRPGASPPPLGDWPQTLAGSSTRSGSRKRRQEQHQINADACVVAESQPPSLLPHVPSQPLSLPPSHTKPQPPSSYRGPARSTVAAEQDRIVTSTNVPDLSLPAGPRTYKHIGSVHSSRSGRSSESGPSVGARPRQRPPPLDLTRKGASPTSHRR